MKKRWERAFVGRGQTVRRGQVCHTPTLHSGDPEFKSMIKDRLP